MVVYISISKNSGVSEREVKLKDIAQLWCDDRAITKQLEELIITIIAKSARKERQIYSAIDVIEKIKRRYPDLEVENLGETDFIIDFIDKRYDFKASKPLNFIKIVAISIVTFFGSAYAIMAYNNDVGTNQIFSGVYKMLTGSTSGDGTLEVSYSVGIFLGIVVFYNHLGKKKLTNDPTPMEVEMRNYEDDLDTAVIKNGERGQN